VNQVLSPLPLADHPHGPFEDQHQPASRRSCPKEGAAGRGAANHRRAAEGAAGFPV